LLALFTLKDQLPLRKKTDSALSSLNTPVCEVLFSVFFTFSVIYTCASSFPDIGAGHFRFAERSQIIEQSMCHLYKNEFSAI